ncbi:MAG: 50S ribosomal protein L21 [Anaerolineales bacterium]|jgi:large subunit ribosomal protein L21
MRYAIVESGGKQYKAVEGQEIEVDRLAAEAGSEVTLGRVLMTADEAGFQIGAPTVDGVEIRATVVDHLAGAKLVHFRYSPKKRIRVRGGHRQQYTRLRVDFIGGKGEARRPAVKSAVPEQSAVEEEAAAPMPAAQAEAAPPTKTAAKKVAAAKKTTAKKAAAKRSATTAKPGKAAGGK